MNLLTMGRTIQLEIMGAYFSVLLSVRNNLEIFIRRPSVALQLSSWSVGLLFSLDIA